jgi:hypothetical protein
MSLTFEIVSLVITVTPFWIVFSLAMTGIFQEGTVVPITIWPLHSSLTLNVAIVKLADIDYPIRIFIPAWAFLDSLFKVAYVFIS